ncbi:MAG: hypothetical protein GKR92_02370 [Gammaproteobacteria bacterium]|nr:MAG: hypothetical protein GKR92_02370 [Gammaproteobacteria bacterium]
MLSFEENYIPDETERLIFLLETYVPFLKKHATEVTQENYNFITKILADRVSHAVLLESIEFIFATEDGKPKVLIPDNGIESKLGPNRSAEYFGLHADICYMVTQHINNKVNICSQ